MSPNARMWTAAVVGALIGLVIGGGIAYYVESQRLEATQQQLAAAKVLAETRNAKAEALAARLEDTLSRLETATEGTGTAGSDVTTPTAQRRRDPITETSARQFAFVKGAEDNAGEITLSLDYAQFLTGAAAAKAAKAAGDESPPPNDYYITNVNPKVRDLKIAPGATFVLAYSSPSDTKTLSAGQFYDVIVNNSDGKAGAGYWFDVVGDTVTGGEEQWTP